MQPIIVPPNSSVEIPIELTPEAIKFINSGKAVKVEVHIVIPWLSHPFIKWSVLLTSCYGVSQIIIQWIEMLATK
jgi:hypothetical protein